MGTTQNEETDRLRALGKFVLQFAAVENLLTMTVWVMAKVSPKVAQAVFPSIRAEVAMQSITRLLEVTDELESKNKIYAEVFDRFRCINEARNLILHYGITSSGEDFVATNKLIALTESRVRSVPVSAEILNEMTADLDKILSHLTVNILSDQNPARAIVGARLEPILQRPWRYKPRSQSTRAKPKLPKSPKRPPPPRSSPA